MGIVTGTSILFDLSPPRRPFGDADFRRGTAQRWDFLGTVPVPLRHRVRDGVADLLADHHTAGGPALKCCFPMGQGGTGPFERLRFIRALEEYPHMIASAEHGNAFNRRFHERHVAGGAFGGFQPDGVAPVFGDCGLIDPQGWLGVFAVAPFVMLVDRHRLGARPVPRRWADLLASDYRGQVVFGGWRRDGEPRYVHYNKFFLLCMLREFGEAGLVRLVRNVPGLMHSAQMPRLAGSNQSLGGIYVLPWALADLCPRRGHTQVVWPEDGALAYPLWLTAKHAQHGRLSPLLEHFHGPELGVYLNDNRYPALYPGLAPTVPAGARLKWLGWDYVRHPATAKDVSSADRIFHQNQEPLSCG